MGISGPASIAFSATQDSRNEDIMNLEAGALKCETEDNITEQ